MNYFLKGLIGCKTYLKASATMPSRLKCKKKMYQRSYTLLLEFIKRNDYWEFSFMVDKIGEDVNKPLYIIKLQYTNFKNKGESTLRQAKKVACLKCHLKI